MHAPSNASLVDAATPVDPLACALADCPACLGAYLAALDQAPHPTTCSCGNVWTAARRPRAAPVDVPADLEALARWLPTIAGRALPLGDAGGASGGRLDGRPDHVDERHRDARSGLRTALTALSTLDAMERAGEARHVKILWFAYVLTGPELAARAGLEVLVANRFTSQEQLAAWAAHKSRLVREARKRAHGERLLTGARAAYEGAARGGGQAPAPPSADHRQLARTVDELVARTAAKVASAAAKVASDSREVANETSPEK